MCPTGRCAVCLMEATVVAEEVVKPGELPPQGAPEPMIVVENLHKSFGQQTVLAGVSLTVQQGETLCILGRSGVGKSVSLQQLMGAVVSEGSGRVLASSGVTLAKTGTAEYGTATPPLTHAWMVAARGDLAVAAYVENGVSGSQSAAPLIAAFLAAYTG